ncbi:alpha/beta fold hydrolase, partial [Oligoflexia bacterium]|nr:alpha/beta fold hydrolase [Oligoflexia bacterium]
TLNYDFMADELLTLLANHQFGPVHLVGYSMGGRLALYLALRHADRFATLCVENGSPGIEDGAERNERLKLDHDRAKAIFDVGLEDFLHGWYQAPLFDSLATQKTKLHNLIRRRVIENSPQWVAKVIAEMSPGHSPNLWPELPSLTLPLLWISGALDQQYATIASRVETLLPQQNFVQFKNAGHNIHLEDEAGFVHALTTFLKEHS